MSVGKSLGKQIASFGIAALCFGYFASYIPYTMFTKMLTSGLFEGMDGKGFTGFQIQPVCVFASFVSMYTFITCKGWWKYCTHSKVLGVSVPRPQWFTFLSGLCTAGQIITTTLAYTFSGISIVFAMLLMRGGVLIIAPMVDLIVKKRKRKIYWPSWIASILSLAALFVGFSSKAGTALTTIATIDISLYLFGYFFRLFIMSNRAKSDDADERKRYFSEEQMVANVVLFGALAIVGLFGRGGAPESLATQVWEGFSLLPFSGYFWAIFLTGMFSYGTGLFGSLIFLDKRENAFTVPANRVSSVLAGVISSYLLGFYYTGKYPGSNELIGAALIVGAILFLLYRNIVEKKQASGATQRTRTAHGKNKLILEAAAETE